MPPDQEHPHHFFGDVPLFQKHLEYLVSKDSFQFLELQRRRDAEHAFVSIEASARQNDVAVGMETREIAALQTISVTRRPYVQGGEIPDSPRKFDPGFNKPAAPGDSPFNSRDEYHLTSNRM